MNKKILSISICFLVASCLEIQSVENNKYDQYDTVKANDDNLKKRLVDSIRNDRALKSEYRSHMRWVGWSEYAPYFQNSSYCLQGLYAISSGISILSQTEKFGAKLSPKSGLYWSIGALSLFGIDKALCLISNRLENAPGELSKFYDLGSEKVAKKVGFNDLGRARLIFTIDIEKEPSQYS